LSRSRLLARRLPGRDRPQAGGRSTEEEFQQELKQLRESRATVEPVEEDRPLVDGDWAQISYNGQVQGEEGEALPRSPARTRWSKSAARDAAAFTEALRGSKPGQELKVEVIYPADYTENKLAGKTVAYDVEVKAIKKRTCPS
jgi:trigger factor